jgi:hypothetical protein
VETSGSSLSGQTAATEAARRFSARTVLIPAAFIGLHFVIANLVTILFLLIGAVFGSGSYQDFWYAFSDPDVINQFIADFYPIIATVYAAALIPVYLIYLVLSQKRDSRAFWTGRPKTGLVFTALAIVLGTLGATYLWVSFLESIAPSVPLVHRAMEGYKEMSAAFTPNSGYFWLILGVCIMAPLTEELLFRGIIQGELRKALPEWAAIVIQALLFSAYHLQLVQSSYVLLAGLLLGLLYYWSRSIWVPIIMHVAYNFLGSVLPSLIGENDTLGEGLMWFQIGFIVIGAVLGIRLFLTRRRQAVAGPAN